jgi:carboxymethylenebutenolidase
MTPMQRYVAEEIAVDHADGLLSRREALRRLGLLGLGLPAATALLAACASGDPPAAPATTGAGASPPPPVASGPAVATEAITFAGPAGSLMGAWAAAADPRGAVLVIHENRGLTDHIRSVAGRFAGSGYSALAIDLLSGEGGTASFGDSAAATAALTGRPEEAMVADLRAGLDELARRAPGAKLAVVGFCFGGGMTWTLLAAGEPRLAAAVPFYGPAPSAASFDGSDAAVLGIYAEQDGRVNASRDGAAAALQAAGLTHEMVTYPGVNHAFFNDTGARYDAATAAQAYQKVLDWFGQHLA